MEGIWAGQNVLFAGRDLLVSFFPRSKPVRFGLAGLVLFLLVVGSTSLEKYACERLGLCMIVYEDADLVAQIAGSVYAVDLQAPRAAPAVEVVREGLLVTGRGTQALVLSDDPLARSLRMRPHEATPEQIEAAAETLAELPAHTLMELLGDYPVAIIGNDALGQGLVRRLDAPLAHDNCDAVADSAWRLRALDLLGRDTDDRDELRLSLTGLALGCNMDLLPPDA